MPAIGITGGVATGKSAFCDCLRELMPAAKFFNADVAAREVVDLPEVKEELAREFGREIFLASAQDDAHRAPLQQDLNRDALRAIIFTDAAKRRALEQILHPRIRRQWSALAETHRITPNFFFADIPLLYETGGETLCDRVVVVACSRNIELARLMQRKAMEQHEAEEMMDAQMPLDEKIRRADHMVWNNGDRAGLVEQAQKLVALWNSQVWMKKG